MNMYLLQRNSSERFNILFNIYFKIFAHSHILQNRREEFNFSVVGLQRGIEEISIGEEIKCHGGFQDFNSGIDL